ncbi:uncharacterized protein LOC120165205 [Hibiscus syriacus]|uniref:uncharacterized protein LOC120165205 n=1 Tax=Hibiscus syriacus TaxID=106335 RepID=UPI0019231651|nr:uncharacterized protein LOC120165205 [Hibiscus syriacus]
MDHVASYKVTPNAKCEEPVFVDVFQKFLGVLFSSRDQAWDLYITYAKKRDFSAQQGTTRIYKEENVKLEELFCLKQGLQKSKLNNVDCQCAHQAIIETNCKARIVVNATETEDQWVVSKANKECNHEFYTNVMTPFLRSNRAVTETGLEEVGVGTSQVMNYFKHQAICY